MNSATIHTQAPMKYRRVKPEPAGGDTRANRLSWFKEGLAALGRESFGSVAFPREIGCGLAGGTWWRAAWGSFLDGRRGTATQVGLRSRD